MSDVFVMNKGDRKVFYVDVGEMSPETATEILTEIKQNIRLTR